MQVENTAIITDYYGIELWGKGMDNLQIQQISMEYAIERVNKQAEEPLQKSPGINNEWLASMIEKYQKQYVYTLRSMWVSD